MLDEAALAPLTRLIGVLETKAEYHVRKIHERYQKDRPATAGHFMLNVKDDKSAMWPRVEATKSWGASSG
jgi:hypothetical protein